MISMKVKMSPDILCWCMDSVYLCRKVVYDSYGYAGVTAGCSQGHTESVRDKRLETSLCTDLDKSTATVTANLWGGKHTQTYDKNNNKTIHKQEYRHIVLTCTSE